MVGAVVVVAVVVVVGVAVVEVVVVGGMEAVVVVAGPVSALSVTDLSVSVETTEVGVESTAMSEGTGILVVAEAIPEDEAIAEAGADVSVGKISEIEGLICRCQSSHQISSSVS